MKTAHIEKDKKAGLWMLIEGETGVAWALEEDEVELIKDACEEWLEKKSHEIMKDKLEVYYP